MSVVITSLFTSDDTTLSFVAALPALLAETVRAMAVLHWFDAKLMAKILQITPEKAEQRYAILKNMPIVQTWSESALSIHELARASILDNLWQQQREIYVVWSKRAATHFENQAYESNDLLLQIESVYHQMIATPNIAADNVWNLGNAFNNPFRSDLMSALVKAGLEHDKHKRLKEQIKAKIYYFIFLLLVNNKQVDQIDEFLNRYVKDITYDNVALNSFKLSWPIVEKILPYFILVAVMGAIIIILTTPNVNFYLTAGELKISINKNTFSPTHEKEDL
jgi:hypothetical protein